MGRIGAMGMAAVVAAVLASPVMAASTDIIGPQNDEEISGIFTDFCLSAFPEHAAIDKVAAVRGAIALSPTEVTAYLHDDPGRGWALHTAQANYIVTLELPPYHACAVRRMTPSGIPTVRAYIDAVRGYAAAHGERLFAIPPQKKAQDNGADVTIAGTSAVDAKGQQTDVFAVFLTNYHGRYHGWGVADVGDGVGVEVRLYRRLLD